MSGQFSCSNRLFFCFDQETSIDSLDSNLETNVRHGDFDNTSRMCSGKTFSSHFRGRLLIIHMNVILSTVAVYDS